MLDWIFKREFQVHKTTRNLTRKLIPNYGIKELDFDSNVYSAQFSENGNFCYVSTQDHKVHFYDTTFIDEFKYVGFVQAVIGRWTITDCHLKNEYLAYSSITPYVHLAHLNIDDSVSVESQIPLSMIDQHTDERFGIWSLRFSEDGSKIVIGTSSNSIQLYDIEAKKTLHRIHGHDDDVNAVAFAESSSNVLISGSDDCTIKVWDIRSFGEANQTSGVLVGHTEGITFVSSKNDGRYLLSNGKDQTMKLWDLRKMVSNRTFEKELSRIDPRVHFDYRWMPYPRKTPKKHPFDVSVSTFVGHQVLRTLIRCCFSPAHTTGQKYGITGSADGKVAIYDLNSGDTAKIIDTSKPNKFESRQNLENVEPNHSDASEYVPVDDDNSEYTTEEEEFERKTRVVRDVSWHPYSPCILASQWNPNEGGSVMKYQYRF